MSKHIVLDAEDVYYLLNMMPAMKDITEPLRYMGIIADIHAQATEGDDDDDADTFYEPLKTQVPDVVKLWDEKPKGAPFIPGTTHSPLMSTVKIPHELLYDTGNTAGDFTHIEKMIAKAAADDLTKMMLYGNTPPQFFKVLNGNNADSKIKAIKFVREVTGIGLKEAKDAIETDTNFHFNPDKWDAISLKKKADSAGLVLHFS